MAGLASIALAVAHLERLNGEDEEDSAPLEGSDGRPKAVQSSSNSQSMPYPRLHGRMVSDDSISHENVRRAPPARIMDETPVAMLPVYSVPPPSYYQQWYASGSYQAPPLPPPAPPPPCNTTQNPPSLQETTAVTLSSTAAPDNTSSLPAEGEPPNAGPVAALLHKVSLVTDDLEEFFSLMKAMEQLALPDNAKPAPIPSLDETIVQVQVQRHDVLLGRGGETNHHLGNIQYRQLVKASQPAYLVAKRRDKPRIAAAIVAVVRARSGRFLKKHLGDHSWRDVGNVRAREKTSQALREGAPELRGNVEAYRTQTQLLTEAVHGAPPGPTASSNTVPAGASSEGVVGTANGPTMPMEAAEEASPAMMEAMAPSLMVPPSMMHHFSRHPFHPHAVAIPMVQTSMGYYHHHHPHPHHPMVYHPLPEGVLYHAPPHNYGEPRGMLRAAPTSSSEEPPPKRPALASHERASGEASSWVHPSTTSTTTHAATVSSAENSETEVPPVPPARTLSPASSTSSSSKVTSRGPRIKLLKQRIEDHTAATDVCAEV